MKRPLWIAGCLCSVAMLCFFRFGFSVALIIGAITLFIVLPAVLILTTSHRLNAASLMAVAALLFACIGYLTYSYAVTAPLEQADGTDVTLTVRVQDLSETGRGRLQVLNGDLPRGTILGCSFSSRDIPNWRVWDTVSGVFSLSRSRSNADRADNLLLYASPHADVTVTGNRRPFYAFLTDIRVYARGVLTRYLGDDLAAVPVAMCFADRSLLRDDTLAQFRASGVSHLLVTSGLHVSIIAQAMLLLLQGLRVPRRVSAAVAIAAVVVFMGVCGFGYSVLRAGIMQILFLLAQTGRRESDNLNSLGGAMWLIVFFQPYAVLDIGLWLSFGATLGILLFAPAMHRAVHSVKPKWVRGILQSLCITLAATVLILPLTVICFGELSLIAPIANLCTVWLAQPLLILVYLAVLLSLVSFLSWAVDGLLWLAGQITRYLLWITKALASLPFADIRIDKLYVVFWLIGTVGLLILFAKLYGKRGIIRAAAWSTLSLCAGVLVYHASMYDVTTITALQTKNTAALLIQNGSRTALVMAGDDFSSADDTVTALKYAGITKLDVLILPDETATDAVIDSHMITDAIPVHTVYAISAATTESAQRFMSGDGTALTAWDGLRIEDGPNGWTRLCIGDARVLLCPEHGGDATTLPDIWRETDLLVFHHSVPKHITAVSARYGMVLCDESAIPALTKALPWGMYPLSFQTEISQWMIRESGALYSVNGGVVS